MCFFISVSQSTFSLRKTRNFFVFFRVVDLFALRKNTPYDGIECTSIHLNQRRQADSSDASHNQIALPYHIEQQQQQPINHSLIYIWNVGDFTFSQAIPNERLPPYTSACIDYAIWQCTRHWVQCTQQYHSQWNSIVSKMHRCKMQTIKIESRRSTEHKQRKAIKASSRIILCYKWRQFLSLFSFWTRPVQPGPSGKSKSKIRKCNGN